MILYNIRHRGPYEYDKFILNIFQIRTETKRLLEEFKASANTDIAQKKDKIDACIDLMSSETGLLQDILMAQLAIDE